MNEPRWVERPPAPCHITGKDAPDGGPYLVEDFHYAAVVAGESGPRVLPRILPVVHAASWIKRICDAPGSPFVAITHEQAMAHEVTRDELDEARQRIEELEAEVASLTAAPPIDVQALASALVIPLEGHFARKTGPKPPRAA